MSSFSENFQREDTTQSGNAQYDDSAFYSFASTMLLIAIISLIVIILRRLKIDNKYSDQKYKNCNCKACKERLKRILSRERKKKIKLHFLFLYYTYLFIKLFINFISNSSSKKLWKY